jgi:two-component system nitrogen regulation response regulator GlnG/two-component system response regulator HydG
MTDTSTDLDLKFPWQTARSASAEPLPHLVIAWSADETERAGEVAPVEGPTVLGRGAAPEKDGIQRAAFFQERPTGFEPRPALESKRISRSQLELRPRGGDAIEVRRIGRASLSVNGEPASSAVLHAGDTLTLAGTLVLLVVSRPRRMPELRHLSRDAARFEFGRPDGFGLVGESPAAWALRDQIAFAASSSQHVLVDGESGTGKELVARAIHALSRRGKGPFVSRNAATFPEGLIDAELFGTAKDYPNAGMPRRTGLIGDADGGTLFLDEIGELPAAMQSHLLRVLDHGGEYQRLGESAVQRSDLRLVAATNRDLAELKHDLAARLKARITVPGLANRLEDVPLLIRHVAERLLSEHSRLSRRFRGGSAGRGAVAVEPALVEALCRHRYVQHLRELERLLLLAFESSPGNYLALTPALERALDLAQASTSTEPTKEQVEEALSRAGGSATRAAAILGLKNRYALYRLARKHGLSPGDDP